MSLTMEDGSAIIIIIIHIIVTIILHARRMLCKPPRNLGRHRVTLELLRVLTCLV
jgi:hypothetical protein